MTFRKTQSSVNHVHLSHSSSSGTVGVTRDCMKASKKSTSNVVTSKNRINDFECIDIDKARSFHHWEGALHWSLPMLFNTNKCEWYYAFTSRRVDVRRRWFWVVGLLRFLVSYVSSPQCGSLSVPVEGRVRPSKIIVKLCLHHLCSNTVSPALTIRHGLVRIPKWHFPAPLCIAKPNSLFRSGIWYVKTQFPFPIRHPGE